MKTVKDCEALYPIGMGWQDNVRLASPSDDENMSNLSARSGYSSQGEFNSLRYMSDLRSNTLRQMEEGKSSTADDTEATSQAQTSVMQGETSSAASNLSKSPAILA